MTVAIFLGALLGAMALGIPIAYALLATGVALMLHLDMFDAQIVTQSATLRALESAKKVNRDAVAAQKVVVAGLQTKYAAVLDRIAVIDGTIALGGCLA